jgi:long-chain acyl-CoA synthetase
MVPQTDNDVFLAALPLFHAFGQSVILNAGFLRHATLVLMPRFDASAALNLMIAEKVSLFAGVPTMYWGLLAKQSDLALEQIDQITANLATVTSGGSALPLEVLNNFADRFGVNIYEGYGLSETSPVASFNRPDRPAKAGSIGQPIWGVEMKLIEDDWTDVGEGPGEIAIRSHCVMMGYFRRPDATAEVLRDGWFRTGDIARRDEDGYYYTIDRSKDLIIRGGFNVYPREVEEVLMTHPGVSRGGRRRPARQPRRGDQGVRHPGPRRHEHRGRDRLLGEGEPRELQVPARRGVPGRAADDRHREDPQARASLIPYAYDP